MSLIDAEELLKYLDDVMAATDDMILLSVKRKIEELKIKQQLIKQTNDTKSNNRPT